MDFSTLPVDAIHRYLAQYDLIPTVYPSPLSVHDPPPPSLLGAPTRGPSRGGSPPAVTTPANRPRRESREQSRRRSSRLLEEEGRARTPVLADVAEVQTVLASIAQRHFEGQVVKEFDSRAFMRAVKGRGTVYSPGFYEGVVLYITLQPSLLHFGRRSFGALIRIKKKIQCRGGNRVLIGFLSDPCLATSDWRPGLLKNLLNPRCFAFSPSLHSPSFIL